MSRSELRTLLERLEIPDEHDARVRAWDTLERAFAEREPVRRPARLLRPALVLAAVIAIVAAAVSAPGRAVVDSVREAIGVEGAEPALFSLPARGRLLVTSDRGAWVVQADGSKRLLAGYRQAAWSPHGLFVVAARQSELAALEPDGSEHWTLARPDVRFPRWGGSRTDTRIAYLTGSRLHVVAGDGTGDIDAGGLPAAARIAPAWRPGGPPHVLAYVDTRGRVYAFDADATADFWPRRPVRSAPFAGPRKLLWSPDGRRLLLVGRDRLVTFGTRSARPVEVRTVRGITDAAFARDGRLALVRVRGGRSAVLVGRRRLFEGTGRFTDLAWSPDGRWLVVAWRDADQWLFLRADGRRDVEAVASISTQFRSRTFPSIAGWCCR